MRVFYFWDPRNLVQKSKTQPKNTYTFFLGFPKKPHAKKMEAAVALRRRFTASADGLGQSRLDLSCIAACAAMRGVRKRFFGSSKPEKPKL